jgi:hypothetical protein
MHTAKIKLLALTLTIQIISIRLEFNIKKAYRLLP